ncbi:MAG: response regulator transcription factor [Bryobacteraceae bacterium]|jgi:DNA-binding response OmpR family regulator
MRVLVAEDKPRTVRTLVRAIERDGHSVALASDGDQALAMGLCSGLDVIVLGVMLPRRDGFEVIRRLRAAKRNTPAILVTPRGSTADMVRGLDLGADDCLAEPFALDVLLARIRALHRRNPVTYPPDLEFGDLRLKARTHELQRGSRVVALTRTEYALLETLMRRAGAIVPKNVLAEAGWGSDAGVNDGTLYVFIGALRARIAAEGERQFLRTVRGIGYTLLADAP